MRGYQTFTACAAHRQVMRYAPLLAALVRSISVKSVLFALAVIYIGVNLFTGQQGLISWRANALREAELKAELDTLAQRRAVVEAQLQQLDPASMDADLVEEIAARDLMMVRPGDVVVMLPPAAPAATSPPAAVSTP